MKNIAFALVFAALVSGCKKEETTPPAVDPNIIQATEIRINATAMPSSITATDKFSLAGNFRLDAEQWKPAGSSKYELVKSADGKTWSADVPLSALPATGDFEYKVVKNAMADATDAWKFGEKKTDCTELDNRKVTSASTQGGKEFNITVENFRNTGTCPN